MSRRLASEARERLREAESFYRGIRPWILLREEDAVLIVPPNRVYKLGGSALGLLTWIDSGGRLSEMPGLEREGREGQLLAFFEELRAAYEGRPPRGAPKGAPNAAVTSGAVGAGATDGSPGTASFGRVPYSFDFTRLPILGEIALTYRCNERCRFCYASCGGADGARPGSASELSTEEWKRIIKLLRDEAKIPFFSFTGGEPLLRSDLEELAAYARSLGLRVNLITNGSLASAERAASLKASGIDTAQVSLESPDREIHDALCGVDGAWDRTTAGISRLLEAGISVQTNSTLTALNRESLLELPVFLGSIGVERFSMNLFIPAGRGLDGDELFVPYSEVGATVDAVRRAAHLAGRSFFWYSPTPYCLYNPVARGLGNKSCAAMDGLIHVNPRGEILPCSSWPESLGSLVGTRFKDIWFSERAAYFKQKRFAPEACAECESFVACQGACPLYWAYAGDSQELRPQLRVARNYIVTAEGMDRVKTEALTEEGIPCKTISGS